MSHSQPRESLVETTLPKTVRVVEVGPRDGLQNEPEPVSTPHKLLFIQKLAEAGLKHIEASSFVSPKWVPQLGDAEEIFANLPQQAGVAYSALVPNMKGFERAVASGVRHIAVFTAASETFVQHNMNMSIGASLENFKPIIAAALQENISVRGYISTCFVCPYEGEISRQAVLDVTTRLVELGVEELSVGDTVGAAAPVDVYELVGVLMSCVGLDQLSLHFHDTYGTALANVLAGLEMGVTTFDASAGGLGGCPYAPGASGNLATEDLMYMLGRMGIETGVDLDKLAEASYFIQRTLGRPLPGKGLQRILATKAKAAN
ncbi:MAG: hydroxymethylglutaryl-CoA lyase [Cyanobacteria bacterium HKST-UBA03]|nr:hydroxymethylglutaryl-CoA lyase [Cyanobacteria bacterium HKST-UBA03]